MNLTNRSVTSQGKSKCDKFGPLCGSPAVYSRRLTEVQVNPINSRRNGIGGEDSAATHASSAGPAAVVTRMKIRENQQHRLPNALRAGLARTLICLCLMAIGWMWHSARSEDPQLTLQASAQCGDVRGIEWAVARGATIEGRDAGGLTPLLLAARANHRAAVECLLQHGAKVNAGSDIYGTALILAAQNSEIDMVRYLLAAGADVNALTKTHCTALWCCAISGDANALPIARELIRAGADVNLANETGDTPLILAVATGNIDVARALIIAGADLDQTNRAGECALDVASRAGNSAMVKLLQARGQETARRGSRHPS
jgi:ankyrin repeat protein